jgi:hypothetical protein
MGVGSGRIAIIKQKIRYAPVSPLFTPVRGLTEI